MKQIFTPWRMKFIKSKKPKDKSTKSCLFCQKLKSRKDRENLVLYRGRKGVIILNLYPYSNGHLMVAPNRHLPDFLNLNDSEMLELIKLVRLGVNTLKKAFKPEGFNIGINLGRVSGAGVTGHLHIHIVPRWAGDTNFMPVLSDVRLIPQTLKQTYQILKQSL